MPAGRTLCSYSWRVALLLCLLLVNESWSLAALKPRVSQAGLPRGYPPSPAGGESLLVWTQAAGQKNSQRGTLRPAPDHGRSPDTAVGDEREGHEPGDRPSGAGQD